MPKAKRKVVAKSKTAASTRSSALTTSHNMTTKAASNKKSKSKIVFFCDADTSSEGGFLSPWWISQFQVKDVLYKTAGQYIMAEKARAFGDKKILQDILETEGTEELISLGARIRGVDEKSWRRRASRIAKNANVHKFMSDDTESRDLLKRLKKLGNRELVFADPADDVLGIGFSIADAEKVDREQWGANVFGKSLEAVRTLAKAPGKPKKTQTARGHNPFDTSIFDVGGRLSVNW